jgi:hypothetical protein
LETYQTDNIGEFLVHHREGAPIEKIDSVSCADRDIRQEAVLRFLRGFAQHSGVAVTDENVIDIINDHRFIAGGHLKNVQRDRIRSVRGRGAQAGKDRRTVRLGYVSLPMCGEGESECDMIADCRAESEFEAIEAYKPTEELQEVWERATATERKAICLLAEWQRRKTLKESTKSLWQRAHVLRRQLRSEGSRFQLDPRQL